MGDMKTCGFGQELYLTSSNQEESLGAMRIHRNGNTYRYAKAGATDLAAGKMTVAVDVAAVVTNKAAIAAEVGEKTLRLTIGSSTYAEDYFKDGYMQINDVDGEGFQYEISSSTAVAAGTAITITISDGIRKAITTSSEFTLVHSPYNATIISTTEESQATGVPVTDVVAGKYYWSQTRGEGICLIAGTPAVGSILTLGATAGSVTTASITIATTVTQPVVGTMKGTVGVAGEYKPIFLQID